MVEKSETVTAEDGSARPSTTDLSAVAQSFTEAANEAFKAISVSIRAYQSGNIDLEAFWLDV